jgi:hypothetical protein
MNIQDLQRIRVELSKQIEPPMVPALVVDEKFIIPTPKKGEPEKEYIDRCMASIGGEYDDPSQAVSVCYAQLKDRQK